MDLYAVLGVAKDATLEQIKRAYRTLAKRHHPDAGGDASKFGLVATAYDVLGDEAKRAHYDETGEMPKTEQSKDAEALSIIGGLVDRMTARIIQGEASEYLDLALGLTRDLDGQIQKVETDRKEAVRFETRATAIRKRFKVKQGPNFVGNMLDARIESCRKAIENADRQLTDMKRAKEILSDASFDVAEGAPSSSLGSPHDWYVLNSRAST